MNTTRQRIQALWNKPWGFMVPEIIKDRHILMVETMHGTEIVPCDTLGLDDPPSSEDDKAAFEYAASLTSHGYCGPIVDVESVCEPLSGFVCRLQAPGYMDATDWTYCETEEDVLRWLENEWDSSPQADDEADEIGEG